MEPGHLQQSGQYSLLVAWDRLAARDVGWLTLARDGGMGEVARLQYRLHALEPGHMHQAASLPASGQYSLLLAWDPLANKDVGWLTLARGEGLGEVARLQYRSYGERQEEQEVAGNPYTNCVHGPREEEREREKQGELVISSQDNYSEGGGRGGRYGG